MRQGLADVPVPQLEEQPLLAALRPLAASTKTKPDVVTVIGHVAETCAPPASRTVMVGDALACGLGQEITPVAALMVMPAGALVSE